MTVSTKKVFIDFSFAPIQSGSGSDARDIVRMSTDEFSNLHHLLGVNWPTRSSVLLRPIVYDGIITIFILTDLEL